MKKPPYPTIYGDKTWPRGAHEPPTWWKGVLLALWLVVVIVGASWLMNWLIPDPRPETVCHHVTERGKCECR